MVLVLPMLFFRKRWVYSKDPSTHLRGQDVLEHASPDRSAYVARACIDVPKSSGHHNTICFLGFPVMPELRCNLTAKQEYQIYHYRHIAEIMSNPTPTDPTSSKQYRSANLLVVIVNNDNSVAEHSVTFVHGGKRGELGYDIAPALHGMTLGNTRSDGTVELAACSFNYLGEGYPLRHLRFVRIYSSTGISPLVGHLIQNPTMPLESQPSMPWCILHRLSPGHTADELARIQHIPSNPPPQITAHTRRMLSLL